jgi:hypothetical protein
LWQGLCVGVFICVLICLGHGAASAATACVSTAADLESALLTAATNGETDVIQMVQGTYQGYFSYTSSEPYGLTLEGGYVAGCVSRSVEPSTTLIHGLGVGPVFILRADQEGPVTIDGVTLQNGFGSNYTPGVSLTAQGNLTLTHSVFNNNSGEMAGAFELSSEATLILDNSILTGNVSLFTTSGMSGHTIVVTNNTVVGNHGRFIGGFAVGGMRSR